MFIQCCFTSTETIQTVRDMEPRTSTLTFTRLLSLWKEEENTEHIFKPKYSCYAHGWSFSKGFAPAWPARLTGIKNLLTLSWALLCSCHSSRWCSSFIYYFCRFSISPLMKSLRSTGGQTLSGLWQELACELGARNSLLLLLGLLGFSLYVAYILTGLHHGSHERIPIDGNTDNFRVRV